MPRAFVGSVSQLMSFEYMKEYLNGYKYFDDKALLKSFIGSMAGGVAISVMMNPFDLVLTRLYNQRKLVFSLTSNYFICEIMKNLFYSHRRKG